MSHYLFIEARDPFESSDSRQLFELAGSLIQDGHDVTVYLVQNAVLASRSSASVAGLSQLLGSGQAKVLVDDYSLQERGIEVGELTTGIDISNMDQLVDLIVEGGPKVVWH